MQKSMFSVLQNFIFLMIAFFTINFIFYQYLKNFTVAFRPLYDKSQYLFQNYPSSNIIIGGDSIAEEGIDPRKISTSAVNIAIAGGGITGPLKAIKFFQKVSFSKNDLIILNLSILNLNDSVVHGNLFINQADTFLNIGFEYLIQSWKGEIFENLFTIYQCRFSSCPYTLDNLTTKKIFHETAIQKGYLSRDSSIITNSHSKESFVSQYKNFYSEKFNRKGDIFKNYQYHLRDLSQRKVQLAIVIMPMSDSFKKNILEFGTNENIQEFLRAVQNECNQYPNCKSFNYVNWNNRKLGNAHDTDDYFSDFMHLNKKGSQSFTELFKIDLKRFYPFVNLEV